MNDKDVTALGLTLNPGDSIVIPFLDENGRGPIVEVVFRRMRNRDRAVIAVLAPREIRVVRKVAPECNHKSGTSSARETMGSGIQGVERGYPNGKPRKSD